MKRSFHRIFISTVTIVAFAIAAVASTPARAGNADVAKALAAVLGVVALGAIINEVKDNKERKRSAQVVTPEPFGVVRPVPERVRQKLLPQRCLRNFEVHRGRMQGFGARCLERNYGYASSLPRHCESLVNTPRGMRTVYRARCLGRQGYQLSRN